MSPGVVRGPPADNGSIPVVPRQAGAEGPAVLRRRTSILAPPAKTLRTRQPPLGGRVRIGVAHGRPQAVKLLLSRASLVAERVEIIRFAIERDRTLELAVQVFGPPGQVQPNGLFQRARTGGEQRSCLVQALQPQQALHLQPPGGWTKPALGEALGKVAERREGTFEVFCQGDAPGAIVGGVLSHPAIRCSHPCQGALGRRVVPAPVVRHADGIVGQGAISPGRAVGKALHGAEVRIGAGRKQRPAQLAELRINRTSGARCNRQQGRRQRGDSQTRTRSDHRAH